jgi:hypothetical protein
MIQRNKADERRKVCIVVPDTAAGFLVAELAHGNGLRAWVRGRGDMLCMVVWCRPAEAVALAEAVEAAARSLQVYQLEGVIRAVRDIGREPSRELVEMVARARSAAGRSRSASRHNV